MSDKDKKTAVKKAIVIRANDKVESLLLNNIQTTYDVEGDNNNFTLHFSSENEGKEDYYVINCRGTDNTLVGGVGGKNLLSAKGKDNTLVGNDKHDFLIAVGNWNKLEGEGGDDHLSALGNNNILWGQTGNDILVAVGNLNKLDSNNYLHGDFSNQLSVKGDMNTLIGGGGHDILTAEGDGNDLSGGRGPDILAVSGNANILEGLSGHDQLQAKGYENKLLGGGGDDTLIAEGNKNTLKGGYGNDQLYAKGDENVLEGFYDDNTLIAEGNGNQLKGGKHKDQLTVDGDWNKLSGEGGKDQLQTKGYRNELLGGDDDDILIAEGDVNQLEGGMNNDYLFAKGNRNKLSGGDGEDILIAEGNANFLEGGEGRDIFVIDPTIASQQIITDFDPSQDRLAIVYQSDKKRHFSCTAMHDDTRTIIHIGKATLDIELIIPFSKMIPFAFISSKEQEAIRREITEDYRVVSYTPSMPLGEKALLACYPAPRQSILNLENTLTSYSLPSFDENLEVNTKKEIRISVRTDDMGNIISQRPLTIGDFFVDHQSAVIDLDGKDVPLTEVQTIFFYCLSDDGLQFKPKGEEREIDKHHGFTLDRWDNGIQAISVGDLNTQEVIPVGFNGEDSAQVRIAVGLKNGNVTPFSSYHTTNIMFVPEK